MSDDMKNELPSNVSRRDYFAAKAMQAVALVYLEIETHMRSKNRNLPWCSPLAQQVDLSCEASQTESLYHLAEFAYEVADAMIAVSEPEDGTQ